MLSFSPSILITFEFLMLPTAVTIVGIAGSDFTVRERVRETVSERCKNGNSVYLKGRAFH